MAVVDKVIDLERSYVPMDPNGYPETMHATHMEDLPEHIIPVICYDGFNFLPTQYGYSSYFGVNSKIEIDALTSRIDDIFIVQTDALRNILVALAEDGIWTKEGNASGAWSNIVPLTLPTGSIHLKWTKCVIGSDILMYQEGGASAYVINTGNSFIPTAFVPSFLNMAGQMGIFKAGGRLGFWDSDNSVSWANADSYSDFTPSLETGAGNAKFQQVVGKIVAILQHGNGFIIYCTKSVVVVVRSADANYFWSSDTVFNNNGISYYNQVVMGQPDTTHFAYTTFGFAHIENGKAEYILAEIFSYLKEKREPVYLRILEGRYLFLEIIDADLIFPEVTFTNVEVEATTITWPAGVAAINSPATNLDSTMAGANNIEGSFLNVNNGWTSRSQATDPEVVPIWEDHLSSMFDPTKIKLWKAYNPSTFGNEQYFRTQTYTLGGITKIDGSGTEYFLPPVVPKAPGVASYMHVENNELNFFFKQEMLWYAEDRMYADWEYAITHKDHLTIYHRNDGLGSPITVTGIGQESPIFTTHEYGPYVVPQFLYESNRYYGTPPAGSPIRYSAWLQRSLRKNVTVNVIEKQQLEVTLGPIIGWALSSGSFSADLPAYASYSLMMATLATDAAAAAAANAAQYAADVPGQTITYSAMTITESPTTRVITVRWDRTFSINAGVDHPELVLSCVAGPTDIGFGEDIYYSILDTYQSFNTPTFVLSDAAVCINEELGYTKVKSKGHYAGGVLVDDTVNLYTHDEAGALTALLASGYPNEAAIWAAVGASDKAGCIAAYNAILGQSFTSYLDILDTLSPGWEIGGTSALAEAADYTDQCAATTSPVEKKKFAVNGTDVQSGAPFLVIPPTVTIDGVNYTFGDQILILPESSFLLQDGSIEPLYPLFHGAFVYDLQYKKWGKMGQDYKLLLDYSPVNTEAGDKTITFDLFGVNAGALLADGTIAIFDKFPTASLMRYGKIGYLRRGFTDIETVRLEFRDVATGSITIECSLDGKNPDVALTVSENFSNTNVHAMGVSRSAVWFNIVIQGIFDLKNMQFIGRKKGKR